MEAHLRNRRAPGVPLDAPAVETAAPIMEDSGPGDGQQEQPNAAGGNGGAGTTPTGEALTQELGLLKASVGMVSSRLKELQKKSENDEAYVRFVHNWLETNGTQNQQLAAKVGAFAAGVDRAVEALAKHEEAEAEDATAQEAA